VLYEICRIEPRTTHGQRLEAFVRAALGVNVWSDRALDAVESIEPFDDRGLERQRQAVRVAAARRASLAREEAVLAGIADVIERGDDRAGRAALAGWRGRLLYRRGEFEAAARMQSSAAAEAEWVTARLAAQLNAASAYMEAFRLDEARTTATQARALARKCRHAFAEARAEWVLRSVAYRTGEARLADRELLESVAALSAPDLEAMVALGEAAVAYRAGESGTVRELARRAHRIWTESGESLGALLAASLLHAEGERGSASAAELARRAVDCPTRGVGIQALGLIARGGERPEVPRETVSALAEGVPREHWNEPLEILSVREALDAFG
jgi:hypothetical protein